MQYDWGPVPNLPLVPIHSQIFMFYACNGVKNPFLVQICPWFQYISDLQFNFNVPIHSQMSRLFMFSLCMMQWSKESVLSPNLPRNCWFQYISDLQFNFNVLCNRVYLGTVPILNPNLVPAGLTLSMILPMNSTQLSSSLTRLNILETLRTWNTFSSVSCEPILLAHSLLSPGRR